MKGMHDHIKPPALIFGADGSPEHGKLFAGTPDIRDDD
jgi:hypothetical protein